MKVASVITLDDDINCLVLDEAVFEGNKYYSVVVLDETEEPTDDYVVLKEIIEGNERYVEREGDERILAELVNIFSKSFNDSIAELPEEID